MTSSAITMQIGPYQGVRLPTIRTVAYMNGEAPHLIVRDGSDAKRLPQGQCIPVENSFTQLFNPYPRQVEVLVAYDLPIWIAPETAGITNLQYGATNSNQIFIPTAADQGFALTMRRGRALVRFTDPVVMNNQYNIGIMSGIPANAFSLRPGTLMPTAMPFRFLDAETDESVIAFSGATSAADMTTFRNSLMAQGSTPMKVQGLVYPSNREQAFMIGPDQLLFVRNIAFANPNPILAEVQHLGEDVGAFD